MSSGIYSLTLTPNDRFLCNFFMAIFFIYSLRVFVRNLRRENCRRNIFFSSIRFDAWYGIRTRGLRLPTRLRPLLLGKIFRINKKITMGSFWRKAIVMNLHLTCSTKTVWGRNSDWRVVMTNYVCMYVCICITTSNGGGVHTCMFPYSCSI